MAHIDAVQSGNRAGFALKALSEVLFGKLDGDVAMEAGVAGPVDLAHSTLANRRKDLERTEFIACLQRHVVSISLSQPIGQIATQWTQKQPNRKVRLVEASQESASRKLAEVRRRFLQDRGKAGNSLKRNGSGRLFEYYFPV